jgi:5-amino-6-(5-phospho-D-ribitylamino)uracil phosphatase
VDLRALAVDLDGTLLGPDGRVSARNRTAVQAAVAAGLHVVLATARWHRSAERIADELGLEDPVIACSGAQVRRRTDEVDLHDVRLPHAFAHELFELCDAEDGTMFAYGHTEVTFRMPAAPSERSHPDIVPVSSLAAVDRDPRCVLVFGDALIELVEATLAPRWGDEVRFLESLTGEGRSALTLTARGADKGLALHVACDALGIDVAGVAAFGDSDTDVEMFKVAGAGIAMGQASDAVKSAASWVTGTHAEDGVATVVERLLDGWHPAADPTT